MKDLTKGQWVGAYYFGFNQNADEPLKLKPDKIAFNTITHLFHFWVFPQSDGGLDDVRGSMSYAHSLELTDAAHKAGRKALFSVGGEKSGEQFVLALTNSQSDFVESLITFMTSRNYDGIDIDWEVGLDQNNSIASHKDMFVEFIKALRARMDIAAPGSLLTVAARGGDEGVYEPVIDMLDQINVMTYDIGGGWFTKSWHNAPLLSYWILDFNPPRASVSEIMDEYVSTNIPASKLSVGIPFYAKVFRGVSEPGRILLDKNTDAIGSDDLKRNYSQTFEQIYRWDESASAPFLSIDDPLYTENKRFISFDDENTVAAKVQYAMRKGFGVFAFELGQAPSLVGAINMAKAGSSSQPMAMSSRWVYGTGSIDFDEAGLNPLLLAIAMNSCTGEGQISASRYSDAPSDRRFVGTSPKYVSPYRWVINQTGLSSITAQVLFDVSSLRNGIPNPSAITVYKRPAEGIGSFIPVTTRYVASAQTIVATVSSFSEFIFGSNDNSFTTITDQEPIATRFLLDQNFPNPFNPSTTIRYGLPSRSHVSLTVYNTLGQGVATLMNGEQDPGYHEVRFDGAHLPSGVYFYRMQAGSFTETKKLLLVK